MSIKINDKRGKEEPKEVCRCCGSEQVHTREYNNHIKKCVEYLRKRVSELEREVTKVKK